MARPITDAAHRTIPHQELVEAVVDERSASLPATPPTVADPAAPGAAYDQTQATAQHNALTSLLAACREAGIVK